MTEQYFDTFLAYLQAFPLGDRLVTIAAYGAPMLVVLAIIAIALFARGWVIYLLASSEDRAHLHEGNPGFYWNQRLVFVAFCIAFGSALVNAHSVSLFLRKLTVAIILQVVAMLVTRFIMLHSYRSMVHRKSIPAGIELGIVTIGVAIVTLLGMMR